ncbi:sialidase family protein [Prosthecobacter sp.]|uniref:sialidase family protein n=1 Tax=Prosthecobacter sp. TaxID=1965333 RepID=UPI0037836B7A
MKIIAACLFALSLVSLHAQETEPAKLQRVVAIENVCAWPNLTLLPDGTIVAILFNQPGHGTMQGDVDCYVSTDGLKWEKRSTVTQHEPDTIRMNHSAGLAKNGDLLVLCSGWTNIKQAIRPKQEPFRDAVLRSWVLRSKDAGRTWTKSDVFPATESAEWTEHIPFGDIWTAQDGTLRTSTYQGQIANPGQSSKTKAWRSWCFRSDDDGLTWKPQSIIGPTHNETDIFPLGGRSWLAAARTVQMELFRSDDDGATWGPPLKVTARNEINGHLTRLADKRLLLSYGIRIAEKHGVCAKFSSDDGKTWSAPIRLARSNVSDCGYPSSIQLANGKIVTAYYSKSAPECAHYHMGAVVWEAPAP